MDEATLRDDMIEGLEHALERPLSSPLVSALRSVRREAFVEHAPYQNRSDVVCGTRVLAPATVARLIECLDPEPNDDVLVVGVGVGYTAGVLAEIVGERNVHAIDIDRTLVYRARENLDRAGYSGVLVDRADGARGFSAYAPYDRILLEAAVVEPPRSLLEQLASGGRLVMPQGRTDQQLVAIETDGPPDESDLQRSTSDDYAIVETGGPARFRPMLVDGEQASGPIRNRTHREDAEFAQRGYFAKHGWEHEWIDWEETLR